MGDPIAQALAEVTTEGAKFLDGGRSDETRQALIDKARALIAAAETPVETLLWNIWALPARTVAARIAVDLKIFQTAVEGDGSPKTDEDLAAATGASPLLVKRIARSCVSMKMLDERGPGLYIPNELTRLLTRQEYYGGIIHCFDSTQPSFAQLPSYLRKTGFKNPEDAMDGPFQYANNGISAFTWLTQHPEVFQAFHGYIHALRIHRPSWTEMYPVQEHLISGLKTEPGDASAFVDVGGGTGQILQDFHAAVPEYTGRLVLQEQAPVIQAAEAGGLGQSRRIELQVHDFFTPQPIKGARAYLFRSVLHDWPDEQCRTILGHIKDAMVPGYSRILISDFVLADEGAAWQHVSLDLFMMALLSARERTEREWRQLIESVGLQIRRIYSKGEGNEGLIEVVLPSE